MARKTHCTDTQRSVQRACRAFTWEQEADCSAELAATAMLRRTPPRRVSSVAAAPGRYYAHTHLQLVHRIRTILVTATKLYARLSSLRKLRQERKRDDGVRPAAEETHTVFCAKPAVPALQRDWSLYSWHRERRRGSFFLLAPPTAERTPRARARFLSLSLAL